MSTPTIAPFGAWKSPISAAVVATASMPLSSPAIDGTNIYWLEGRATENGRTVLVQLNAEGERNEIIPPPFNVRTRVHEYGGGAYLVDGDDIYFSNFSDNQIYAACGDATPRLITRNSNCRYADLVLDRTRRRLVCIREEHSEAGQEAEAQQDGQAGQEREAGQEAVNRLVAIALDGSGSETVLGEGCDFYSSPRVSPDGVYLAWLSWNHPNMPWDGCELWRARFDASGGLCEQENIAGGANESIFQPDWSPEARLYFVSDRTGWWNLYRANEGNSEPLCAMEADFGRAQWQFGMSMYGFASSEEIVCSYIHQGVYALARLNVSTGTLIAIDTPYTDIQEVRLGGGFAVLVAGSASRPLEVLKLDLAGGDLQVLARSVAELPTAEMLSSPHAVSFPSSGGRTAHGFYYTPANPCFAGPADSAPPLIVISHGGPTAMTTSTLRMSIQYWTSRGFALLDVNYGGSIGYGRAYRESLNGQWGIVDVDDCENGALYLVRQGLANPRQLIIRGGSAGGFTTLCALAFGGTFKAGASHYGVSDVSALLADTHKFESRYLLRLVGDDAAAYAARSPIYHAEQISCPVIFFQGLDDKVVPPEQSERMASALKKRRIPVAYVSYEGEGHGFRKAENIERTLEAELYFYARVFGLELPEKIAPVQIDNL